MADTSKSGVFFDTKTNKVVNSQPEEGVQLVAPGQEITPDRQAEIDLYNDGYADPNAVADQPATVTTDAASSKKK